MMPRNSGQAPGRKDTTMVSIITQAENPGQIYAIVMQYLQSAVIHRVHHIEHFPASLTAYPSEEVYEAGVTLNSG